MSVSDGQDVNAAVTNAAFLSRLVDSDTIGEIDLKNASYTDLISLQRIINEALSSLGISNQAATDANANVHSSNNTGIDGNDRKAALGILDALFNAATGHTHDGTAGQGPKVSAADLSNFNNLFAEFGEYTFDAASSTSIDVTSLFSSQSSGGDASTEGVITSAPNNYVPIVEKTTGGEIEDGEGDRVFGRLTESGGTWTLSFFTNESGTETAHSLASQDIRFLYREVFTAANRPTIGANVGVYDTQSAIGDIPDASASQRGVVSTGSQTFQGAKNFLLRPTVNSNDVVDVSAAQTLQFKDYDGGTASDTSRMTLPKNTTLGLDATTDKEGTIAYDTDKDTVVFNDGVDWLELTGGAGGGGLDVWHTENFEDTVAADFSSSNDTTFGVTGTAFAGTLADETVSPIAGTSSLKYTQASGSLDDWFKSPTISLDDKQSGNTSGITLYFTYSGDPSDIQFVFYDETGSAVLTASEDLFTTQSNPTRYATSVSIPSTSTSVSWGAHVKVENIGAVLVVDDVEFSTDPFVVQDLQDVQTIRLHTANGFGSTNNKIRRFSTLIENTGDGIITYADSATDGASFTVNRDCKVSISYIENFSAVENLGLSINSTQLTSGISTINAADRLAYETTPAANQGSTIAWSGDVLAGDVIRPHNGGTAAGISGRVSFTITAEADSPALITPAKSNLTDWESYTPTSQGFGAISGVDFKWRRLGDSMEIQGRFAAGTVTATEAQIGLPAGYTVDSTVQPSIELVGQWANTNPLVAQGNMIATGGDAFLNFTSAAQGNNGLAAINGNQISNSSTTTTLFARVPIEGWSSDVNFLAAIPEDLGVKPALYNSQVTQVVPVSAWTKMNFGIVETDQDGLVTNPSTDWKYICPKDGVYEITSQFSMPTSNVDLNEAQSMSIWVNGSQNKIMDHNRYDVTTSETYYLAGSCKVSLSKGDEIELRIFQSTNASGITIGGNGPNNDYISVTREQTPVSFGGDIRQETITLDATGSGSYTAGGVKVTRVGSQVTITLEPSLSHGSASNPISATNFIPSWATPTANAASSVAAMDSVGLVRIIVNTSGQLELQYRDYTGTLQNRTAISTLTLSYNVD